jgi:hypothetical protein
LSEPVIEFHAVVYKLQTLVDGGIRLVLDLPETAIPQMAMLAECKRQGIPLNISCTQIEPVEVGIKTDERINRRKQIYPYKADK